MRCIAGCLAVACLGGSLAVVPVAHATPYWSPEKIQSMAQAVPSGGSGEFLPWSSRSHDYFLEFERVCEFIEALQVSDPADPEYGGLREAEHMLNVVQTDNTSELIWTLSRYHELTGSTQYDDNIAAAWTYESNFPAYNEEGGSANTTGYYRIYNCAWALRAEMKYRQVFGDASHTPYADSCASYLCWHNLVQTADPLYIIINSTVLAWAAGNLYDYGLDRANPAFLAKGEARGRRVKGWADTDPGLLGDEGWAMSGGSIMWGVLNSYYAAYPESTQIWASAKGPDMNTYADAGDFTDAWNGWYALGHLAAGTALNDPAYLANHHALTDTLLFEDGDDDGGIPAKPADPDSMDQAWIANYNGFMGLNALVEATLVADLAGRSLPRVTLEGNWPNPFNPCTMITFTIPERTSVSLRIYDVQGALVRTLLDGTLEEGRSAVPWDGLDEAGHPAAPGVYFSRLRAGQAVVSGKMVLVQ